MKKKREKGWRTALAGMACLAMLLGLTGEQFRAGAAWSPGQQGGAVSRRVVPLGRAVGIKLFSDGVLVVGSRFFFTVTVSSKFPCCTV